MGAGSRWRELVFSLIRLHFTWWGNRPEIHGMQEVWGSNPHSSTQFRRPIRNLYR